MKIGRRDFFIFLKRICSIDNYKAIPRFINVHKKPIEAIYQEIFSTGKYPREIEFKSPIGIFKAKLYSSADFSTFNLIFCRQDYFVPKNFKTVMDIGSNIGLSTMYWLTRNSNCKVYCYEPSSKNFEKLKDNLKLFKSRFFLHPFAVSNYNAYGYLNIDETGVYTSLNDKNSNINFVGKEKCKIIDINSCLEKILKESNEIDIIKIDNEGEELKTILSIDESFWKFIRCINVDGMNVRQYVPSNFKSDIVGSAQRFYRN